MAYDEDMAARIRDILAPERGLSEKRMFGGLAFLQHGRMALAASGHGGLMVRVDPADTEGLVDDVHVHRMVMRGRPMTGWLRVDAPAIDADEDLHAWVRRGLAVVRTLPPT